MVILHCLQTVACIFDCILLSPCVLANMVFKCCVFNCSTGKNKKGVATEENAAVFSFPDKEKEPERYLTWFKFVNRKDFAVTKNTKVCEKHFEDRFIRRGKRNTLIHDLLPVPTIQTYADDVPPSIIPTPSPPTRKPPLQRRFPNSPAEDELKKFLSYDVIAKYEELDETYAPDGMLFKRGDDYVVFYELVSKDELGVPLVRAAIRVDSQLHVRLFLEGNPVPQPEWFRKGNNQNSKLTSRGGLINLVNHIRGWESKSLLDELHKIRNMKPQGRPPYSPDMLRFALRIRYTSKQAYKMLLEEFPFPCLSLLQKLKEGGKDAMKAVKLLLEKGELDKDIVLLLDEMILQKEESYQGGSIVGADEYGELFKGILTFMIVGLRKNIPSVIRAVPEVTISGALVQKHIHECLNLLSDSGFNVRAVISDDHSTNVSAYTMLLDKYGVNPLTRAIVHPSSSRRIYLMFDAVHLIKNIRNNLLNYKRFIFPSFQFDQFRDDINVPAGEMRWKTLLDVHDLDQHLDAHLRFAPKLSYRALHPGDNKQNVPYALAVFHGTTSASVRRYYPEKEDAASFLSLIDTWWTIVNSKQKINTNNRLGNGAVHGDCKPEFLRKFADWLDEWFDSQIPNCRKFTLSAQTNSALASTCRALACLIEDLLNEGYDYVLTSRFLTDFLERRFSRYRQMSGGRFLVALREVLNSAQICMMTSLLKAGINVWEEDLKDETHDQDLEKLVLEASKMRFDEITLKKESMEVVAYIGGYIVKSLLDKEKNSTCSACKTCLLDHDNEINTEYLRLVSRGGLRTPSSALMQYTGSMFGMLQMLEPVIRKFNVNERRACERLFELYGAAPDFVCEEHNEWAGKIANRIIVNIFYNNVQKASKDKKRKQSVAEGLKKRQRTK